MVMRSARDHHQRSNGVSSPVERERSVFHGEAIAINEQSLSVSMETPKKQQRNNAVAQQQRRITPPPSSRSRRELAVRIQSWWRGASVRKRFTVEKKKVPRSNNRNGNTTPIRMDNRLETVGVITSAPKKSPPPQPLQLIQTATTSTSTQQQHNSNTPTVITSSSAHERPNQQSESHSPAEKKKKNSSNHQLIPSELPSLTRTTSADRLMRLRRLVRYDFEDRRPLPVRPQFGIIHSLPFDRSDDQAVDTDLLLSDGCMTTRLQNDDTNIPTNVGNIYPPTHQIGRNFPPPRHPPPRRRMPLPQHHKYLKPLNQSAPLLRLMPQQSTAVHNNISDPDDDDRELLFSNKTMHAMSLRVGTNRLGPEKLGVTNVAPNGWY
jgi:hypothetical protein